MADYQPRTKMADYVALPFICSSNDENYVNEGIKKKGFFYDSY